jgi:glycogen operon protein
MPTGMEFTDDEWLDEEQRSLGMVLNGDEIADRGLRGEPVADQSLMVLMHSGDADIAWTIPGGWGDSWALVLDSAAEADQPAIGPTRPVRAGETVDVTGRSIVVLQRL